MNEFANHGTLFKAEVFLITSKMSLWSWQLLPPYPSAPDLLLHPTLTPQSTSTFSGSLISVQFSHSVVADSACHELQHARPPCPIPTPRVHPNPHPSVSDAIQPSHSLSSPSPPALKLSQHQGLFKWVSSLYQVAKVLEFQLQHQSSNEQQDWFPLGWTGWISLQSKGLSRIFSNTTLQQDQLFSAQLSL